MSNPLLVAASRAALALAVVGCGNSSNNSDANPSGDGNNSNPDGVGPSSGSGRYFDHGFFYDDVSQTPVAVNSKTIIAALRAKGGWGAGDVMRIDNTIEVVDASAASPRAPYEPREVSVDCDEAPVTTTSANSATCASVPLSLRYQLSVRRVGANRPKQWPNRADPGPP